VSYPANTQEILRSLGFIPETDFSVSSSPITEVITLSWLSAATEPTEQEIIDAGNSAEFAAWYADHGGDPVLTRRRIAREAIEGLRDTDHLIRAALFAIVDELNRHADKHNEILDAVDAAVSLADFKSRVAAIGDYPQRTRPQLKAAAVDIINDGTSD
jgi:hypothetical protein